MGVFTSLRVSWRHLICLASFGHHSQTISLGSKLSTHQQTTLFEELLLPQHPTLQVRVDGSILPHNTAATFMPASWWVLFFLKQSNIFNFLCSYTFILATTSTPPTHCRHTSGPVTLHTGSADTQECLHCMCCQGRTCPNTWHVEEGHPLEGNAFRPPSKAKTLGLNVAIPVCWAQCIMPSCSCVSVPGQHRRPVTRMLLVAWCTPPHKFNISVVP